MCLSPYRPCSKILKLKYPEDVQLERERESLRVIIRMNANWQSTEQSLVFDAENGKITAVTPN